MAWFSEVPVKVLAFDELLGPIPVDFIKMDVQGWEFEVLKGMDRVLRANPEVRIYFEFWQYGLRRAGSDPLELFSYLQARSFLVYEPRGGAWVPIRDPEQFCGRINQHRYINLFAVPAATPL